MAQVQISQLPSAGAITGSELVPVVQNGVTVKTTTGAIAASPAQTQTFITLNQEPSLPNSRYLSTGTGLGLVDGGAQSFYRLTLNGTSGSLETAGIGLIAKTGGATVTARTLTASGAGIAVSDGDGVAGNPTVVLSGLPLALANTGGTGFLAVVGGTAIAGRQFYGTANQISITNGNGSDSPVISMVPNPVLPGNQAVRLPSGGSSDRPVLGTPGEIRYNSDTDEYEVYQGGNWVDLTTSAGFIDVYNNGTFVGTQDGLNFIPGSGMAYTIVNDIPNNRVNITQAVSSTLSLTTLNTTNLEVQNIKSLDGIAAGSIQAGTGVITLNSSILVTTQITGGNINATIIGNTLPSAGTFTTVTANDVNTVTADATNLEVTNIKAKDGTAAATIANTTGVVTINSAVLTTADINAGTIDATTIGATTPAAGTFTTATATDVNATTVDTTSIEVTNIKAKDGTSAGTIADGTGVVTLNSAVLTTADINGGTIDNAVIGGTTPTTGTFTTVAATTGNITTVNSTTVDTTDIEVTNLKAKDGTSAGSIADTTGVVTLNSAVLTTADINGGTIDGTAIGGSTPSTATFTTVGATTGNITTVNATTVDTTDIEVQNLKAKDGTAAGSIADTTGVVTLNSAILTTADINGGTIDNVTIGSSNAGAITGTTITANTQFTGSGAGLTSIPNGALQNSSITVGTTSISLGGSSLTLGGLTSVAVTQNPTLALQLAPKQYVDALVSSGITYHYPVKYEVPNSTGNLNATYNNGAAGVGATLTNAGTLAAFAPDGPTAQVGDRILIYNQTNAFENGVYEVTVVGDGSTAWVLTRTSDADTYALKSINGLGEGDAFFIQSGNTGAGETYVCNTQGIITFGTTAITFAQISSAQVYSAGTGLTLTGTQFSITSTGVSAATYGSASSVPVLAINAQGQATSAVDTPIAIAASQVTSGTLAIAQGGTNTSSTPTAGGIAYGSGTAYAFTLVGASGQVLTSTGAGTPTWTTATDANTVNAIVQRDASGNFSAGTITAALSGNASTATALQTARTIALQDGVTGTATSFNGTANISIPVTSVAASYLSGTIPTGVLGNSTLYVGTTSIALNRASANQSLTGITSIDFPGATSGTITLQPIAVAGTTAITLPATTGTLITTGDTGTVTNTMLANSTISGVSLGSSLFALTLGSYLTGTSYNGSAAITAAVDATSANTASKVVARDGNGDFSAGIITASLNGNANTATSATNATNIGITDDTSTNATMYPVWVTANTGNLPAKVTSTKFSFNPSTGVVTATGGVSGGTF
jgi:hypothetical protein